MEKRPKHLRHVLAFTSVVLVCFIACAVYATSTMSFPIAAVDSALFHDVTFDYNGGTDNDKNPGKSERFFFWENPVPPSPPSRVGYDFEGWNISEDNGLYLACWKLHVYSLTYNFDYGTLVDCSPDSLPATCTIESPNIELPQQLSRYAYTFDGWTAGESEERVTAIDCSQIFQDTDVCAHWSRFDIFKPSTIYLGDEFTAVPYIFCLGSEEAPANTAGIWQGAGLVDDEKPSYYLGHNPGVFTPVASFAEGSRFTICDDNDNLGVYEVERIITILYENTIWTPELEEISMPDGEYASLQTCRGDKVFMDIFVGRRIDG